MAYIGAMPHERPVLDAEAVDRALRRMATAIVEATRGTESVALIGVARGGVPLAARIAEALYALEGRQVPVGTVDISLYRDDAAAALPNPRIGPSDVPFSVEDRDVILVDDVLQTGRTVRAAIDCLQDHGRPRRVWLAVLIDRGGRELPIAADFVGREVEVPASALVEVTLERGADRVAIVGGEP